MRNLDYQNTQIYFNLGCDFLVTSKSFKDILVPRDANSREVFKAVIKDFIDG